MFKLTKHSFLNSISDLIWIQTLTFFLLLFKGERIQISLKAGHHRPASEMAFRWRADDGPTLNAGLVVLRISRDLVQYCQEILYFCDPLDPRMGLDNVYTY